MYTLYTVYMYMGMLTVGASYMLYKNKFKKGFSKNDRICRDVKTEKVCERGWDG